MVFRRKKNILREMFQVGGACVAQLPYTSPFRLRLQIVCLTLQWETLLVIVSVCCLQEALSQKGCSPVAQKQSVCIAAIKFESRDKMLTLFRQKSLHNSMFIACVRERQWTGYIFQRVFRVELPFNEYVIESCVSRIV